MLRPSFVITDICSAQKGKREDIMLPQQWMDPKVQDKASTTSTGKVTFPNKTKLN